MFLMMNNQVYSHTILPNEPLVLGPIEIDGSNYEIQLRMKSTVSAGDPEYTQLMGRFFKLMLKKQNLLQIGRKYFDPKDSKRFD